MQRISCSSSLGFIPSLLNGGVFSLEVTESRPGLLVFRATGKGVDATFANESGGHRWQRPSPTDKRGRVHPSTVTVAVLPEPDETVLIIRDDEIEWTATRAGGAGGQKVNKTSSAVIAKHVPSGLTVRCENERSQLQNRNTAFALLRARLAKRQQDERLGIVADDRRAQVGSGMRGDKRRTIRVQDGIVTDHVLGERWELKSYLRGDW